MASERARIEKGPNRKGHERCIVLNQHSVRNFSKFGLLRLLVLSDLSATLRHEWCCQSELQLRWGAPRSRSRSSWRRNPEASSPGSRARLAARRAPPAPAGTPGCLQRPRSAAPSAPTGSADWCPLRRARPESSAAPLRRSPLRLRTGVLLARTKRYAVAWLCFRVVSNSGKFSLRFGPSVLSPSRCSPVAT